MRIMRRLKVGILGATGMVGQRFVTLLESHPWFEVVVLAASANSAGKSYQEAIGGRWKLKEKIPQALKNMTVLAIERDIDKIYRPVDFVFSAFEADKETTKRIEEKYAQAGVAVVSNNSAHRWTLDVPMIIPEINAYHVKLIDAQRKKRGWKKGLIVVKPNCSLQSYLPIIYALSKFRPVYVEVTTLQAISGAGKTFSDWPEMVDNVIPFIGGEEEKTEKEPMKILGFLKDGYIKLADQPKISATCIRVAASDGHMASVSVKFKRKPTLAEIIKSLHNLITSLDNLDLPSSPKRFIKYFTEEDRPQTKLDRDFENGMGITCGRFRENPHFDWKFIALSHNTIRGAAGGAILTAELLYRKGYIEGKNNT